MKERFVASFALAAIVAGGVGEAFGNPVFAHRIWAAGAIAVLIPLSLDTLRSLSRGDVGVDAIALVAIVWALALGEELAAVIVALMMSGGGALEAWAAGKARRELRLLVERAPRIAHRYVDGTVEEVGVEHLQPGDVTVVRAGEIVPADGTVAAGVAVIDESALTGEALAVTSTVGAPVRSGTANAGDPFDLRITRPAAESAYASIVRLVTEAQSDRAPFTRLADRYAAFFLPLSLAVAGLAWLVAGDPVRGLAVMVVATPCPLILAAPVAFVAGLSRAAGAGIIVKGAGVLEQLGGARTVLLDKTGTLTVGLAEVERIDEVGDLASGEAFRLAASLDQMSAHALAESLVAAAVARGVSLSVPRDVSEDAGRGIVGEVDGHRVAVGSSSWLEAQGHPGVRAHERVLDDVDGPGRARVLVGVDGSLAAVIVMGDRLRPGAEALVPHLLRLGVDRVALVSGDRAEVTAEVARAVGIEEVYSEQGPGDKLDIVRAILEIPGRRNVVMVGDGINDAPALALADVGIAMAGKGATISSQTADMVITVDDAGRVAQSIEIGQRSLHIARQSVVFGLGLSFAAMVVAAFGYLPPVWGALLQEGIDVAVILNALRALRA